MKKESPNFVYYGKSPIVEMEEKIRNLSCRTLITRLEFCFENVKMRKAMQKVKRFTNRVKKTESV